MTTDNILAPIAALALPDSAALTGRAAQALSFIESFTIDSQEAYELAGEELQAIKARAKTLETQRTGLTVPLNNVLRGINDLFRGPADLLIKGEGMLKTKMLAWQSEQERIAAEVRRAAEAVAAAERQRLADEAAARQREAEAQARAAATAAAAQAEAQRQAEAAIAAGNAEAAAAARRESEAQAQAVALAQAATQRAQAEAQAAATESQLVTASALVAAAPKAAGISTSTKIDFDVTSLRLLVAYIATGKVYEEGDPALAHPELLGLLAADTVRLRAYVKGLGKACNLPGVRVFEARVMSARAA